MASELDRLLALVDNDHRAIAVLFEGLGRICSRDENARDGCAACPAATVAGCEEALQEVTTALLALLLEHFEREEALLQRAAQRRSTFAHMEAHRAAHADFTRRYNRLATTGNALDAMRDIRAWQVFLHDWVKEHALTFDGELAQLVHAAGHESITR